MAIARGVVKILLMVVPCPKIRSFPVFKVFTFPKSTPPEELSKPFDRPSKIFPTAEAAKAAEQPSMSFGECSFYAAASAHVT
jgi:hypothetical protein